jgi:hypothetical protein
VPSWVADAIPRRARYDDRAVLDVPAARERSDRVREGFEVGDRVELVAVPEGFTALRVGQQGVVLIPPEPAGEGEALATVRFSRRGAGAARPVRIAPHYLRLVSRRARGARRTSAAPGGP